MARAYHVDGPVLIKTGTGASAALEELGISEDGPDVSFNVFADAVFSDAAGPRVPVDLQRMGEDATVRVRLVDYDLVVWKKLVALAMGNVTVGTGGSPGGLIATGGSAYRLVLTSLDDPLRFTTATLRNPQALKMGTVIKKPVLEFYCWRFVPAGTNTANAIKLFDNTDA